MSLARQIDAWKPEGFTSRLEESVPEDGPVLELSDDEKRLYLEPARWADREVPARVDLWSNVGTRVRLVGPAADGEWRVLTSDLVDMDVDWRSDRMNRLLNRLVLR